MAIFYTETDQGASVVYRLKFKYRYSLIAAAIPIAGWLIAGLLGYQTVSGFFILLLFVLAITVIVISIPVHIARMRAAWKGKKIAYQRVDGYWQLEIEK